MLWIPPPPPLPRQVWSSIVGQTEFKCWAARVYLPRISVMCKVDVDLTWSHGFRLMNRLVVCSTRVGLVV